MLWRQNTPDLFDTFSAGMVLLQLALPALRSEKAFKGFAQDMEQCGSMRDWCAGVASRKSARRALSLRTAAVLACVGGAEGALCYRTRWRG